MLIQNYNKSSVIIFSLILSFSFQSLYSQEALNCYPNCDVTYGQVRSLRIPNTVTSSNNCLVIMQKQIAEWEADDSKVANKLRNEYCSAQLGWQLKPGKDCQHGGPPPCCPKVGNECPWINVGPQNALRQLFASWSEIYSRRKKVIDRLAKDCNDTEKEKKYRQKILKYEEAMSQGDFVNARLILNNEVSVYVTENVRDSYKDLVNNHYKRVDAYNNEKNRNNEEIKKEKIRNAEADKKEKEDFEKNSKVTKEKKQSTQNQNSKNNKTSSSGSTKPLPSLEQLARERAIYNDQMEKKILKI